MFSVTPSMLLSVAEYNYIIDLMGSGWLVEGDNFTTYLTHSVTGFSFSASCSRRDYWGDLVGFTDEGRAVPSGCFCSPPACDDVQNADDEDGEPVPGCEGGEHHWECTVSDWENIGDGVECTHCDSGGGVEYITLYVEEFGSMVDEEGETVLDADGDEWDVDPLGGYFSHLVGWLQTLQTEIVLDTAPIFVEMVSDTVSGGFSYGWETGRDNTPINLGGPVVEFQRIKAEYRRDGVQLRFSNDMTRFTVRACWPGVGVTSLDFTEGDALELLLNWLVDSSAPCPFYVANVVA